ncbi:RCC1 domain-containing protein [Pyxidicoccus trucidator]|uniref:RCC1 domain-containing protein n=1 Tax=Pyxidicoccus trucidator TaxID=2709662 RepID=UPI0013DB0257|nr:RCC1 repeat-containing protein [Pyxidicoccus trucidator]
MHQKLWSWKKPRSPRCLAVLLLTLAVGCGDEDTSPPPPDRNPRLLTFDEGTQSATSVRVQQSITFRVAVRNAGASSLRFTWKSSSGSFLPPSNTETTSEVRWVAPDCADRGDGDPSISVTATDTKTDSVSRAFAVSIPRCRALLVASGDAHSLARLEDGTVWAWGNNSHGQLGDGTTATRPTPVQVAGLFGTTALAAGGTHSLALDTTGIVRAWGSNAYGQLGGGTSTQSASPVQVSGLSGVTAISAGTHHSLALREDGTVWAWGRNQVGQLGDGTQTQRDTPVQVSGLSGVTAISAGTEHSLALREDGTVWVWGTDGYGQLGNGAEGPLWSFTPVPVTGLTGITAISAGFGHSLAVRDDGTLWAWGLDGAGQIGDGAPASFGVEAPVQVSGLTGVLAADAGGGHSMALRGDGTVWAWGSNDTGQLGDAVPAGVHPAPVQVSGLTRVTAISAGIAHNLALLEDGTVPGWGDNSGGMLGNGRTTNRFTPVPVALLTDVTRLAAGDHHTVALRDDGTVWAWGSNTASQVGDATSVRVRSQPVQVPGLTEVVSVSAGGDHTLAVRNDGTVWTWGSNSANPRSASPVQVSGLTGVRAVATDRLHSLALRDDGTVWAWGDNSTGALGDGTTEERDTRVQVSGLTGVVAISTGLIHSVAVREDGTVWTWGNDENGQLGDGTIGGNQAMPAQVPGLTGITAVAARLGHTLALRDDGTVWAWGFNNAGQLGDGSTTQRASPVQVSGLTGITAIFAGYTHSLAVGADGGVWAWGSNGAGQLGDGSGSQRPIPVRHSGASGITAVAAGRNHSVARRGDGTLLAWGSNSLGQVGDGTSASNPIPAPALLP